jgi:hypothetical protein
MGTKGLNKTSDQISSSSNSYKDKGGIVDELNRSRMARFKITGEENKPQTVQLNTVHQDGAENLLLTSN